MRATKRVWIPAAAALLLASCGLPLELGEPTVLNQCSATSDCGEGAACASVRGQRTCVATSIDLAGLILEVRPSPGAAIAADTSYLIDPANPGMNEFSQDPFQVRGTNPSGIVQSFDLRLPRLVTIARGLVTPDDADAASTCTLASSSLAADVELQRVSTYVGLPTARYTASTSVVGANALAANAFHIAVPPDTYNVYVTPKPPSAAGSVGCDLPSLPPAYFPAQLIAHDADLNITLPALRYVSGTLEVPKGADVAGWTVELVEPTSGKSISTAATFGGDIGKVVEFELAYYWTFKSSPIIRLRPPARRGRRPHGLLGARLGGPQRRRQDRAHPVEPRRRAEARRGFGHRRQRRARRRLHRDPEHQPLRAHERRLPHHHRDWGRRRVQRRSTPRRLPCARPPHGRRHQGARHRLVDYPRRGPLLWAQRRARRSGHARREPRRSLG